MRTQQQAKSIGCCIASPVVWVYSSMDIFLLGCTAIYSRRLLNSCTSRVCSSFTDTEFPATSRSLGKWHDKTPEEIDKEVEWYRADELFAPIPEEEEKGDCTHKPKCFLFEGRIEGNDIDQGQLGDCWLMTALACLAEASPDAIVNLFMTREYVTFSPSIYLSLFVCCSLLLCGAVYQNHGV